MSLGTDRGASEMAELQAQVERLRLELNGQREELDRELIRRAYQIGELEQSLTQTSQEFESSLSWKLTKPLRVGKALLDELRRR